MSKKTKKSEMSEMSLELIGGVFCVETFSDGKELRTEIDGKVILELLLVVISDYARNTIKSNAATLCNKRKTINKM